MSNTGKRNETFGWNKLCVRRTLACLVHLIFETNSIVFGRLSENGQEQ